MDAAAPLALGVASALGMPYLSLALDARIREKYALYWSEAALTCRECGKPDTRRDGAVHFLCSSGTAVTVADWVSDFMTLFASGLVVILGLVVVANSVLERSVYGCLTVALIVLLVWLLGQDPITYGHERPSEEWRTKSADLPVVHWKVTLRIPHSRTILCVAAINGAAAILFALK